MIATVVLLSKNNGQTQFTDDCLKEFAKKNKTLKSSISKITNIRYDAVEGKVFGDLNITLRAAVNGVIHSRLETPQGELITDFRPKDVNIFISKK